MATLARLADVTVDQAQGLAGKRAAALQKVGIRSVPHLLLHVPRRYIDRSRVTDIASLPLGAEVTIIGTVASAATRRPPRNLTTTAARGTVGVSSFQAAWFNPAFR